ncbi:MAG: glucose 1-dehydrogenase [Actinomycetota bacterium]|nr:glucose 1-dehydrogenase [Actinomycetota bacterium]
MRAVAVSPGRRSVEIVEHDEPQLASATDVALRMLEVGVCGTDREIATFEYGDPPPGSDHLVIGHEALARVVDVGPGVTALEPGALVVPMVRRPCSHDSCRPCRSARQDFCATGDFSERGIKQQHGYMAEAVVDDQEYMSLVPEELRPVAVLVEPLTIAEKALEQVGQIQRRLPWGTDGHTAVVLGAGPVGLLGAMALIVAGFETWVYSRSPAPNEKATAAEAVGARYLSSETHSVDHLREEAGNIDLVYEAVGASKPAFDVLRVLATNGVFVFTGVPGRKAPIEVDTDRLMRDLVLRNQVVLGSVNAGKAAFDAAVSHLGEFDRRWPEAVRSLVTHHPMEAYEELLMVRAGGIKQVVDMGEDS